MSAGQILIIGIIAFTVAAFLNSRTLLDMAERQPYGGGREPCASASRLPPHGEPIDAKPGEAVDDIRNRHRQTSSMS